MRFIIARAARTTGSMLERLVREYMQREGIREPDCVVCYGAGYTGPLPALNAAVGGTKMSQGQTLLRALPGEALEIFPINGRQITHTGFPLVARKLNHTKGRDIRVCKTPAGMRVVLANGRHAYFTKLVESDTEYRVWVYRKRILAVYEKRLTEPEKNVKFGRNRDNGWTFHALNAENIPESVRRVGIAAVAALNLDFGAVDILGKWDQDHHDVHATVLEVNSAPGVSDEHRTAIVKLTRRIARWAANNCPTREAQQGPEAA